MLLKPLSVAAYVSQTRLSIADLVGTLHAAPNAWSLEYIMAEEDVRSPFSLRAGADNWARERLRESNWSKHAEETILSYSKRS